MEIGAARVQILLVEDDDDLRTEIAQYLVRRGHVLTACGSLTEARANLSRMTIGERVETVICDVNLPDGNGVDFCCEASAVLPEARWLLMSGGHEAEEQAERLATIPGPQRWLMVDKPVSMRQLNAALAP